MDITQVSSQKLPVNILKLMQPELLSFEELVTILREKGVGSNLLTHSKDKLVSLFKTVALPLPQREFRKNFRGLKLRKKAEREKISLTSADEHKSFTIGVSEAVSSTMRCVEQKCDRLKPPPELVSSERKRIRLNNNSRKAQIQSNSCSDLDKVVIKKHETSQSKNPPNDMNNCEINHKLEMDRLSSDNSEDKRNDKSNRSKNIPPKRISLKRNHLTSTSSSESTSEKSPSEPDKKRKPITWP